MSTLNLNQQVEVTLTAKGVKMLSTYHKGVTARVFLAPLWEIAHIFGQELYNGQPDPPFESLNVSLYPSETRGVDQIRAEIARLEGELASISGDPLVIWEHGETFHDIPPGGALLTYAPALAEYGYEHWYPTVEAAKAALLKLARENKAAVDKTGLNLDLTPEGAQFSTSAYITRRS